nr:glycosyltransferase [Oenococcus oeni]
MEQVLTNYTCLLNRNCPVDQLIVYQHLPDKDRLKNLMLAGNRTKKIPSKSKNLILNLIETFKIIHDEKPDIVHAHMNLLNFVPLLVAKILGVKVRICHSHISQDNIKLKFLVPIFKKLNIYSANHLVACGLEAGKYMFKDRKFQIIYNAIFQDSFKFSQEKRNEMREKFNLASDTIVLGHIGRLTKQKNQIFLIDVFNFYKEKVNENSKLFIIGAGEEQSPVLNKIYESKFKNDIFYINKTLCPMNFYNLFDFFLLPSLYEGMPIVGIEAQTTGLYTLFSNHIDKSAKISNQSQAVFLSLDEGPTVWANAIKHSRPRQRSNFVEPNNKYNIYFEYIKLFNYYKTCLDEVS